MNISNIITHLDGSFGEIHSALADLGESELRDILTFMIKYYMIDGTTHVRAEQHSVVENTVFSVSSKHASFVNLLTELKKEYDFDELRAFEMDEHSVYVTIQGNKYLFSRINQDNSNKEENTKSFEDKKSNPVKPGSSRFSSLEID